jgi:hypothetical protein
MFRVLLVALTCVGCQAPAAPARDAGAPRDGGGSGLFIRFHWPRHLGRWDPGSAHEVIVGKQRQRARVQVTLPDRGAGWTAKRDDSGDVLLLPRVGDPLGMRISLWKAYTDERPRRIVARAQDLAALATDQLASSPRWKVRPRRERSGAFFHSLEAETREFGLLTRIGIDRMLPEPPPTGDAMFDSFKTGQEHVLSCDAVVDAAHRDWLDDVERACRGLRYTFVFDVPD